MTTLKRLFPQLGMELICSLFGKTRQGWYKHQQHLESVYFRETMVIMKVNQIRKDMPRIGTRKLYLMLSDHLQDHNIKIGRDALFRLLKQRGMLIRKRKNYTKTTLSLHRFRKYPNLIKDVNLYRPEQVWVCDITYIRTRLGFSYLSLITDLYSHLIVGYYLSPDLSADGCLKCLKMAMNNRSAEMPLTHHSDRGIQYCSERYVEVLLSQDINISMTESGSPYDNAVAERVNGILKDEFNLYDTFETHKIASKSVDKAIETYNYKRPHNSCGNLTPYNAHQSKVPFKKLWKNYYKKNQLNEEANTLVEME